MMLQYVLLSVKQRPIQDKSMTCGGAAIHLFEAASLRQGEDKASLAVANMTLVSFNTKMFVTLFLASHKTNALILSRSFYNKVR